MSLGLLWEDAKKWRSITRGASKTSALAECEDSQFGMRLW